MKAPADRPPGFPPIISELERILAEMDAPTSYIPVATQQTEAPPAPAPAKPAWLLPVVLVAVIGLAAGLYFAMKPRKPAETIATKSGEMVLVPAGHFLYGQGKTDTTTGAYYIDRAEVPNQAYAQFCKESGHALPTDFPPDKPNLPVVNVTIGDAAAFAKWAGQRLPSAREWEKAARGPDGLDFPWGNQADPSRANLQSSSLRPVDDFAQFASPYKTLQMIGNVWELVDDLATPSDRAIADFASKLTPAPTLSDAWHQARGGSYRQPPLNPGLVWDETPIPEHWKAADIGFRCVKDAQ
jgi:formylglycine-generating enzyme required for sulfatase activity